MTQSAVSQHVRALEEQLATRLLVRERRRATATDAGHLLYGAVRDGLGRISEACAEIRRQARSEPNKLTISTLPGFAVKWLFPRLIDFDQKHPDIELSISADPHPVDLKSGAVDLAIRYGAGGYGGLYVEKVFADRLFPVAAPSLINGDPPLRDVADLSRHMVLRDEITAIGANRPGWPMWLKAVGAPEAVIQRSRRFGQSNMVLQAAVDGLGVALGRDVLAIDDLTAGRLARPFAEIVPSGYAYYFVCSKDRLDDPGITAFRDWLLAQSEAMPPLPPSNSIP